MAKAAPISQEFNSVELSDTHTDRRAAERYVTVLKVGKAIIDGHDQLCLVRNMSQKGMKVMLPHGVRNDQRVDIELRSDRVIHGTVRWTDENVAGVEFDEPLSIDEILQHRHVRSVLRKAPRAPRFDRHEFVNVEFSDSKIDARMVNISLHGICIDLDHVLRVGELAVIRIKDLPARTAHVQWVGNHMAGLHFELPLSFAELANWLDEHD